MHVALANPFASREARWPKLALSFNTIALQAEVVPMPRDRPEAIALHLGKGRAPLEGDERTRCSQFDCFAHNNSRPVCFVLLRNLDCKPSAFPIPTLDR